MSDIADREAESTSAVAGAGGSFARRPGGYVTPRCKALPPCSCGGRPRYTPHPPLTRGGQLLETLACACGNSVGPFSSRGALAMAWRLGGYDAAARQELGFRI